MDVDHHNHNNGAGTCAEDIAQPSDSQAPSRDRKKGRKGTPWTEEEHRMFLAGLQKLGKGDWKGIAHGYVTSRTPTQVASHAQKYFIRQSNISKKKRRSSLFDITSESRGIAEEERDESSVADCPLQQSPSCTEDHMNAAPCSRDMKTDASSIGSEGGGMLEDEEVPRLVENAAVPQSMQECFLTTPPAFALLVPGWGGFSSSSSQCPIVRPTPILPTSPIQIDLWNGVSELNLSAFPSPPPLSLKLSEHSAFQANPCKKINQSGGKAISVV